MRLPAALTLVAGALSLVLTGCASANQVGAGSGSGPAPSGGVSLPSGTTTGPSMGGTASSPQPTSSTALAAATHCPLPPVTPQTNPAAKPVPDDLQVAWVLRCRIVRGTSGSSTLIAEQSTSDPAALVRALRAPSAQRAKIVCPMLAVYLPNFALVQPDGQVFVPKLPVNNCGLPQSAVVTALGRLTFAQITSHPVK
ncbi:MAG TPA: hypothetical protein VMB79_08470 [Jatrophihabitans sp.]|nr:hypothetical protein [Jatrophihabitans sp.]